MDAPAFCIGSDPDAGDVGQPQQPLLSCNEIKNVLLSNRNFQAQIRPVRNLSALLFPFAGNARNGHTMSRAVDLHQYPPARVSTRPAGLPVRRAFFFPVSEDTRFA